MTLAHQVPPPESSSRRFLRRPILRDQLGLLDLCEYRLLFLVERVTVLLEQAPDHPAQVRLRFLAQGPVNGHVLADGADQLAGDLAQVRVEVDPTVKTVK